MRQAALAHRFLRGKLTGINYCIHICQSFNARRSSPNLMPELPKQGMIGERPDSVGLRQPKLALSDVRKDKLRGDGCDVADPGFSHEPFHVIFLREAVSAMREDRSLA